MLDFILGFAHWSSGDVGLILPFRPKFCDVTLDLSEFVLAHEFSIVKTNTPNFFGHHHLVRQSDSPPLSLYFNFPLLSLDTWTVPAEVWLYSGCFFVFAPIIAGVPPKLHLSRDMLSLWKLASSVPFWLIFPHHFAPIVKNRQNGASS